VLQPLPGIGSLILDSWLLLLGSTIPRRPPE
jgi:hypothetical protein